MIDIDKMNDCLLMGQVDGRVLRYNDHAWDTLLNVWNGHSIHKAQHPAFKAIINDMLKNAMSKNPKDFYPF